VASFVHRTLTGLGHTRKGTTKLIGPVFNKVIITPAHASQHSMQFRYLNTTIDTSSTHVDLGHSRSTRSSIPTGISVGDTEDFHSLAIFFTDSPYDDRHEAVMVGPPPPGLVIGAWITRAPSLQLRRQLVRQRRAAKTGEGPFLHVNLTFIRLSPHSTL
jgi:hypothetical protein